MVGGWDWGAGGVDCSYSLKPQFPSHSTGLIEGRRSQSTSPIFNFIDFQRRRERRRARALRTLSAKDLISSFNSQPVLFTVARVLVLLSIDVISILFVLKAQNVSSRCANWVWAKLQVQSALRIWWSQAFQTWWLFDGWRMGRIHRVYWRDVGTSQEISKVNIGECPFRRSKKNLSI